MKLLKKFIMTIVREKNVNQGVKMVGIKLLKKFDLFSVVT